MELDKIKLLLERYFEGTSTVADEALLNSYFSGDNIAPELQSYKQLFVGFAQARLEVNPKPLQLPAKRFKSTYLKIASIAAAVFFIYLGFNSRTSSTYNYGTYKDPQVALLKAKQAFGLMGQLIDKSSNQLNAVEEFDNITNKYLN